MAWEARPGGHSYYYRSRRCGDRVRRVYVGRGAVAELAAEHDADVKARREVEAAAMRAAQARLGPLEEAMAELDRACALALEAVLTAAGYRRANSEWRRRRERTDPSR